MEKPEQAPISDGLRAAIRSCGRSPNQIAKEVKCSPQQLYNFLGGKRRLSQDIMDALAIALELEVRVRPKPPVEVEVAWTEVDVPPASVVPGKEPHGHPRRKVLEGSNLGGDRPASEPEKQDDQPLQAPPEEPLTAQEPASDDQTPGGGFGSPAPHPDAPKTKLKPRLGRLAPEELKIAFSNYRSPKADLKARPAPGSTRPALGGTGPNGEITSDDVKNVFARKRGVMPANMIFSKPTGRNNPNSAGDVEPEHVAVQQADRKKMLDLWPGTEKLYKSMGRDQEAKKNIYDFLSVLSRSPNTRKYYDYIKGFPLDKIINWSLAFPPEQQVQIANSLPILDDGASEEDPSITKSFWDRVDKESFYKAVERLGFLPDPALKSKYIDRKPRASMTGPNVKPDESGDAEETEVEEPH